MRKSERRIAVRKFLNIVREEQRKKRFFVKGWKLGFGILLESRPNAKLKYLFTNCNNLVALNLLTVYQS